MSNDRKTQTQALSLKTKRDNNERIKARAIKDESAKQRRERYCANAQIDSRAFYRVANVFDYRDVFSAYNKKSILT